MTSSPDPRTVETLRTALMAADYTVDAVLERIGEAGQDGLQRNSTIPALDALVDADDAQATLIKLFTLQEAVPEQAARIIGDLDALAAAGLLTVTDGQVSAPIDVRPYGFEDCAGEFTGWIVADHVPGMNSQTAPTRPDYVLGVSPASTTLAQLTPESRAASALDLGTGCGVQTLHLARHTHRVTATDLNPRAAKLAGLTLALNDIDAELRVGSLYEPVADQQFDLIATNPPYVMSPPAADGERLVYREGGFLGDELVRAVVSGAPAHLTPGGSAHVLANWAITADQPWEERLASWVDGTGADLWVIERERLDVYSYIEMWLTDAGLAGDPSWPRRYREWLRYFEGLGITGVGMGWITVTNAQRAVPDVTIETWPHAVAQPVGGVLAARADALTWAAQPDELLLGTRLAMRPDVVQETMGRPGAADPEYVVLRQNLGLKRAMQVDTALGGVLGACDGELPLGVIIDAVASMLELDATQRAELLAQTREAIRDGYLSPVVNA